MAGTLSDRKVRIGIGLAVGAALAATAAAAGMTRASADGADLAVTVSGNSLVRGGQEITLHGVNRSGTEFACIEDRGIFDGPNDQQSVDAIASWGATVVRVPLNADCWNPTSDTPAQFTGQTYRNAIRDYVSKINTAGMSVVLELHRSSRGDGGQARDHMPESGDASAFWSSVADTFKDNRSVLFELSDEPRDVSGECWRDGCSFGGYQTAGMQEMLDAVRGTGAQNVVIATGLGGGNYLGHWLANRPNDPLNQLAAGFHLYNFSACNSRSCWDGDIAAVAAQVPVITTELGQDDDQTWFIDDFADWADATTGVSYVFWTWNTHSPPSLITDYDGSPTGYGAGARAILQRRSQPAPHPTQSAPAALPTGSTSAPAPSASAPVPSASAPAPTGPAPSASAPAPTRPASSHSAPAPTGPAPTVPAPTGSAPTGPAPTPTDPAPTDAPKARTGARAVVLDAKGSWKSVAQYPSNLRPGTRYTATVFIRGSGTVQLRAHADSWGADLGTRNCTATVQWRACTLRFRTTYGNEVTFRVTDPAAGGTVVLDDASLTSFRYGRNLLADPSFEGGEWVIEEPFRLH